MGVSFGPIGPYPVCQSAGPIREATSGSGRRPYGVARRSLRAQQEVRTAILRPSRSGVVRGDGMVLPVRDRLELRRIDALPLEIANDDGGARRGELPVRGVPLGDL